MRSPQTGIMPSHTVGLFCWNCHCNSTFSLDHTSQRVARSPSTANAPNQTCHHHSCQNVQPPCLQRPALRAPEVSTGEGRLTCCKGACKRQVSSLASRRMGLEMGVEWDDICSLPCFPNLRFWKILILLQDAKISGLPTLNTYKRPWSPQVKSFSLLTKIFLSASRDMSHF